MLHRLPVNQNANLHARSNVSASYTIRNAQNIEYMLEATLREGFENWIANILALCISL